jgi:integrase
MEIWLLLGTGGGETRTQHPLQGAEMVIEQLLKSKTVANRSPFYVKPLRITLTNFAKWIGNVPISSITAQQCEEFINQYQNPATRKTYRAFLSVLFNFSVRRGFRQDNPIERIDHVSIERKVPEILTPDQVETVLAACPSKIRPYFVLATFAGLRPFEIASPLRRLDWSAVNLEAATVSVIGKRRRRMAPLEPRAVRLLSEHADRTGPVCPAHITVARWLHGTACGLLGWEDWKQDCTRHTAASQLLALHQDAGKVSMWMGNSPAILLSHYYSLVSKDDCHRFWKIGDYAPAPTRSEPIDTRQRELDFRPDVSKGQQLRLKLPY